MVRDQLSSASWQNLAERVERISGTRGDGRGFELLSLESDGSERLIEVKATKPVKEMSSLLTAQEVQASIAYVCCYRVYRVLDLAGGPRIYTRPRPLEAWSNLAAPGRRARAAADEGRVVRRALI